MTESSQSGSTGSNTQRGTRAPLNDDRSAVQTPLPPSNAQSPNAVTEHSNLAPVNPVVVEAIANAPLSPSTTQASPVSPDSTPQPHPQGNLQLDPQFNSWMESMPAELRAFFTALFGPSDPHPTQPVAQAGVSSQAASPSQSVPPSDNDRPSNIHPSVPRTPAGDAVPMAPDGAIPSETEANRLASSAAGAFVRSLVGAMAAPIPTPINTLGMRPPMTTVNNPAVFTP